MDSRRAGANVLVPFLTIGGFAGLRSAEIERLDWSKVDLENGYITVDASIAKTNSRRLVPIVPNLKAWFAITPERTKARREEAVLDRKAKIVAHPAMAAA